MVLEEPTQEDLKRMAGEEAAKSVRNGMVVGLGTGSTVRYTIEKLGKMELDITGVPTSKATERLAKRVGIKVCSTNEIDSIDIDIDGADEIDPENNLIKGGGGALTREKIVASMSERMIVVADSSKLVTFLGVFPVAVEVLDFARRSAARVLEKIGATVVEREGTTDNGNIIVDATFGKIEDPEHLEKRINSIAGVIENGIFPKRYVHKVVIGDKEGVKTR